MQRNIIPLLFILLILFGGFGVYYYYKNKISGPVVQTTSSGDLVGIGITIVDDKGNKYTYNSWQPGIPTVLRSGNVTISQIIVTLTINPDFTGTATYLKIVGGQIRFHVTWGTVDNNVQVHDFSLNPIQINNPVAGQVNTVTQWTFLDTDIEGAAGAISHGTALDFRIDITTDLTVEIGVQDAAGNIVPLQQTGGLGTGAVVSMTYEAGVFRGFSVGFNT